jgi:O-antigen ligase
VETDGFPAVRFEAARVARIALQRGQGSVLASLMAPWIAPVACPLPLFLITLTVMLFRPSEFAFYSLDRIAFVTLLCAVLLRTVVRRQEISVYRLTWPMFGLSAMAVTSALSHAFAVKIWSVTAAKFIVPLVFFHFAGLIFESEEDLRWLERFSLTVLGYLIFTAVAFWIGARELVFPRFILDANLGIHAERARGPFLQAVANGVSLNVLGLLAIDRYQSGRINKVWSIVLLVFLPLAILATKTRGVWLSFAISAGWLMFESRESRSGRGSRWLVFALSCGILLAMLNCMPNGLEERLHDNDTVEFRMAAYRAGWNMFLERPLTGWGTNQVQGELAQRIDGFQGEKFAVHNTYFEVLLEHGVSGLGLYLWLVIELIRLGRGTRPVRASGFAGSLRRLWPLLVGVYLVNATFVVMNYQFVNGLLFTYAGILAAQQRQSLEMEESCAAVC